MENETQDVTSTESEAVQTAEPSIDTATPNTAAEQVAPEPEALDTLLDSLSEETAADTPSDQAAEPSDQATAERLRGPDGRFVADETAPADQAAQPATEPAPPAQVTSPLSAEAAEAAEEAELLEGVKEGPRRERLKQVFAARKQAESSLNEIREMVNTTGMTSSDFAQLLEFGRLVNAPDAASHQTALTLVDAVRSNLCQQLGVDAPGVDVLADFPDLAQAVQHMELSRERAVEMARLRKENGSAQQRQQLEATQRQQQQQFEQALTFGQQAMTDYLSRRAQEADHPARMKAVHDYFQQPANVQQFVTTYQPHQWAPAIQLLYDAVRIAPAAAAPAAQPLRTKPNALGASAPDARRSPFDQLDQQLRERGI